MDNLITEENFMVNQPLLMGAIDKIVVKKSIARRVSDVQNMVGPSGIITGAQWSAAEKKLKIAKQNVEAISRKIRTEFTFESLRDLHSIHQEKFYDVLAHYLVDEMIYKIDKDFIDMIKDRATQNSSISFTGAEYDTSLWSVGQAIAVKVSKGLNNLPISDNRSPLGWAIVSSDIAALLNGTINDVNAAGLDDESSSYLGRIGGVEYYIDFTHDNAPTNSVIFGLKGNGISKGSTIVAPYRKDWIEAVDPETGEGIFFLLERSSMVINPLDNEYYDDGNGESAFIGKINVDISDLTVMK